MMSLGLGEKTTKKTRVLPAIPTAVKIDADTAANIVAALEKCITVSLALRPRVPSGNAEVIFLLFFKSQTLVKFFTNCFLQFDKHFN